MSPFGLPLRQLIKFTAINPETSTRIDVGLVQSLRETCDTHKDFYTFFSLALAEYRLRNFEQAITAATSSLEFWQDGPESLAILAMSHFKLGSADTANEFRRKMQAVGDVDEPWDKRLRQSLAKEVEMLLEGNDRPQQDDD